MLALQPRLPSLPLVAPLAAVLGKVASSGLLWFVPLVPKAPWLYFIEGVSDGWPGLLILLVLNLLLNRWIPVRGDGESGDTPKPPSGGKAP